MPIRKKIKDFADKVRSKLPKVPEAPKSPLPKAIQDKYDALKPAHQYYDYVSIVGDQIGPDGETQGAYAIADGKSGNVNRYPLSSDPEDPKAVFVPNGDVGMVMSMGKNSVIVDVSYDGKSRLLHFKHDNLVQLKPADQRVSPLDQWTDPVEPSGTVETGVVPLREDVKASVVVTAEPIVVTAGSYEVALEKLEALAEKSSDSWPPYFIHLTDLEKIGINPKQKYSTTPLGIYGYPLSRRIFKQIKDGTIPFRADADWLYVIKPSEEGVYDLTDRVEDEDWVWMVKEILSQVKDKERRKELRAKVKQMTRDYNGIYGLAYDVSDGDITKWTGILRGLDIRGLMDLNGYGYIHKNEPEQGVFFSVGAFKVLEMLPNPIRKMQEKDEKVDEALDSDYVYNPQTRDYERVFKKQPGDAKAVGLLKSKKWTGDEWSSVKDLIASIKAEDAALQLTNVKNEVVARWLAHVSTQKPWPKVMQALVSSPFEVARRSLAEFGPLDIKLQLVNDPDVYTRRALFSRIYGSDREEIADALRNDTDFYVKNEVERYFTASIVEPIVVTAGTGQKIWSEIEGLVGPDVYFSMTDVNKLGIKPTSDFDTPLGIYAYPLNAEFFQKLKAGRLPFAGDRRYIQVFRGKAFDVSSPEYTKERLEADIQRTKAWVEEKGILELCSVCRGRGEVVVPSLYPAEALTECPTCSGTGRSPESDDVDDLIALARKRTKLKTPFGVLWNVTRKLTNNTVWWNALLRHLGFSGISDLRGSGLIHEMEPVQAVFLTKAAVESLGAFPSPLKNLESKAFDDPLRRLIQKKDVRNILRYVQEREVSRDWVALRIVEGVSEQDLEFLMQELIKADDRMTDAFVHALSGNGRFEQADRIKNQWKKDIDTEWAEVKKAVEQAPIGTTVSFQMMVGGKSVTWKKKGPDQWQNLGGVLMSDEDISAYVNRVADLTPPKTSSLEPIVVTAAGPELLRSRSKAASIVVTACEPIVVTAEAFHGTRSVFTEYDHDRSGLGTHFGSEETAKDIMHKKDWAVVTYRNQPYRVHRVNLDIRHPLRLPDLKNWDVEDLLATLPKDVQEADPELWTSLQEVFGYWIERDKARHELGKYFDENYGPPDRKRPGYEDRKEAIRKIRLLIEKAGYDSIVYSNRYENGGDSYIVWNSSIIRPLSSDTYESPSGKKLSSLVVTAEAKPTHCTHCNKPVPNSEVFGRGDRWFHRPCMSKGPIGTRKEAIVVTAAPKKEGLAAVHNLSAANLLHADEVGGLIAPSIAVTRPSLWGDSYGEVTLVAPMGMVDPTQTPVFDADIYSSRYPDVRFKPNYDKIYKFQNEYKPYADKADGYLGDLDYNIQNYGHEALDRGRIAPALKLAFLEKVKGMNLEPPMIEARLGIEWVKAPSLKQFFESVGGFNHDSRPGDEWWASFSQAVDKAIVEFWNAQADLDPELKTEMIQASKEDNFKDDGTLFFGNGDRIWKNYQKLGQKEIDRYAFRDQIDELIKPFEAEYSEWAKQQLSPLIGKRYLTSPGGKNMQYTPENVLKLMTKKLKGGEAFNYGAGSLRALGAKKFKSFEEMEAHSDRLVSSEEMDKLKDGINGELLELVEKLRPYHGASDSPRMMDAVMSAIGESYKRGRSLTMELAKDGFKTVPSQLLKEVFDFRKKLVSMPTQYFEAKPQRIIPLSEFKAAVVPKTSSQSVFQVLAKHGLQVFTFDPKRKNSRSRALAKAVKMSKTAQFIVVTADTEHEGAPKWLAPAVMGLGLGMSSPATGDQGEGRSSPAQPAPVSAPAPQTAPAAPEAPRAPVVVTPADRAAERRARLYKRLVERAATKHALDPKLLDAVIYTESKYLPAAASGAGAQGLMQLNKITQEELGVTDPLDPAESIDAGAKYLSRLMKRFDGNLDHVLAAYNAGPGNVRKHKGVPPFKETREYIERVKSRMQKSGARRRKANASVAAVAVVNDAGEVLIQHRTGTAPWMPNKWDFPGGSLDHGEDAASAARREAEEEAGLTLSALKPLTTVGDVQFFVSEVSGRQNVQHRPNHEGILEHDKSVWVTKETYTNYDIVPPVLEALKVLWPL